MQKHLLAYYGERMSTPSGVSKHYSEEQGFALVHGTTRFTGQEENEIIHWLKSSESANFTAPHDPVATKGTKDVDAAQFGNTTDTSALAKSKLPRMQVLCR